MFALALSVLPASTAISPATQVSQLPVPAPQARAYGETTRELYTPPAVRPYEPPSDFGRQLAEGDADATGRTRPIDAPVAVEAYSETYEARRSPRELGYQQGVEAARRSQNARMGLLDGEWCAVDVEGRPVLDLVLSDRGAGRPVEGALRLALSDRTIPIERVTADGETRIIAASLEGRPVELRLHRQGEVWKGELAGLGRATSLTLIRPEGW